MLQEIRRVIESEGVVGVNTVMLVLMPGTEES